MEIKEIANRLIELIRISDYDTALRDLYAQDAISIEQNPGPNFEKETRGLTNIISKGEKFTSMVETWHSVKVGEPIIAQHSFAFTMGFDLSMKGHGRINMSEIGVYTVKDGKIVAEQFFE